VDVNWYGIRALKLLGLAKQIQHASLAKSPREGVPTPQGKLIETY
jgi:fatty-acid desaturase